MPPKLLFQYVWRDTSFCISSYMDLIFVSVYFPLNSVQTPISYQNQNCPIITFRRHPFYLFLRAIMCKSEQSDALNAQSGAGIAFERAPEMWPLIILLPYPTPTAPCYFSLCFSKNLKYHQSGFSCIIRSSTLLGWATNYIRSMPDQCPWFLLSLSCDIITAKRHFVSASSHYFLDSQHDIDRLVNFIDGNFQ